MLCLVIGRLPDHPFLCYEQGSGSAFAIAWLYVESVLLSVGSVVDGRACRDWSCRQVTRASFFLASSRWGVIVGHVSRASAREALCEAGGAWMCFRQNSAYCTRTRLRFVLPFSRFRVGSVLFSALRRLCRAPLRLPLIVRFDCFSWIASGMQKQQQQQQRSHHTAINALPIFPALTTAVRFETRMDRECHSLYMRA